MSIFSLFRTSVCLLFVGLVFSPHSWHAEAIADETIDKTSLQKKLAAIFGGGRRYIEADEIQLIDSEVKGFYIMQYAGKYGLVSKDGKHYLSGDVWNIDEGENLTDEFRQRFNLTQLHNIDDNLPISFKAKKPKSSIWVFTDIDCGYCRRLHSEILELNTLGVTVHYLSFPRSGNKSQVDWQKARDVWCARDPQSAMTASKQGRDVSGVPKVRDCQPKIAQQYELGRKLGVRATPTIVLANGRIVAGYMPAKQLSSQAIANHP